MGNSDLEAIINFRQLFSNKTFRQFTYIVVNDISVSCMAVLKVLSFGNVI